jgi:hypothetical protein
MIEAKRTPETSVKFFMITWRNTQKAIISILAAGIFSEVELSNLKLI